MKEIQLDRAVDRIPSQDELGEMRLITEGMKQSEWAQCCQEYHAVGSRGRKGYSDTHEHQARVEFLSCISSIGEWHSRSTCFPDLRSH